MIKALLSRDADPAERLRVLLADHDQAMLALTVDALAGECLVVGRVDDGCELLAEAERSHPDAMVLDITMSRFDGIEAARQLRRSQRSVRLVFLTVHEDPNYARTGSDARGLGHVVKARTASDRGRASQATLPIVTSSRPPCLDQGDQPLRLSRRNQTPKSGKP